MEAPNANRKTSRDDLDEESVGKIKYPYFSRLILDEEQQHRASPNVSQPTSVDLAELCKNPSRAHSKPLIRTSTEPNIDAGNYPNFNVVVDSIGVNIPSTSKAPNGHGITRQYALYLEFEGGSSGDGYREHQERMRAAGIAAAKETMDELA